LKLLVLLVLYSILSLASSCDDGGFISQECIERDIYGKFDENLVYNGFKKVFLDARNTALNMLDNLIVNVIGPYTFCKSTNPVDVSNLLNTVGIIVFISLLLIYILNAIASIFGLQWRISLLDEAFQALLTILVVILIVGVINYYTYNNIFIQAKQYVVNIIINFSFFSMLLKTIETMLVALSNITIPFGPPDARAIFGVSFSQLFTIVFKSFDVIKGFFNLAILEYVFKLFLLCVGPRVIIDLLLPIGALMRAFYFTRPGGNVLLGISIAFIVIYPLIMYIYSKIYSQISYIWEIDLAEAAYRMVIAALIGAISSKLIPAAARALRSSTFDTLRNLININQVWNALNNFGHIISMNSFGIGAVIGLLYFLPALMYIIFGYLQLALVFAVILGPLALYFTVSLTGQISRALGTEINIAALSRLI